MLGRRISFSSGRRCGVAIIRPMYNGIMSYEKELIFIITMKFIEDFK
jgi:hypothetical protein